MPLAFAELSFVGYTSCEGQRAFAFEFVVYELAFVGIEFSKSESALIITPSVFMLAFLDALSCNHGFIFIFFARK